MSFEIAAEFDDKEVKKFFDQATANLKEIKGGGKKYLATLGSIVFRDIVEHFEQQKGPDGTWKAWSNIYAEHMRRTGRGGNKLLQFNGRLRQNFKPTSVRTSSKGVHWYNDARTKSGFPYAFAHDEGMNDRPPQRQFMWLSDKALDEIENQTLEFMLREGK